MQSALDKMGTPLVSPNYSVEPVQQLDSSLSLLHVSSNGDTVMLDLKKIHRIYM